MYRLSTFPIFAKLTNTRNIFSSAVRSAMAPIEMIVLSACLHASMRVALPPTNCAVRNGNTRAVPRFEIALAKSTKRGIPQRPP